MEFPYLEEAWKQYQDRVAVIALSVEAGDTAPKLTEFARTNGLTFPIGSDIGVGLDGYFEVTAIPTSVIVDRFGNVVWMDFCKEQLIEELNKLIAAHGSAKP